MAHYHRDGEVVGWGPTVQEIDSLTTLFQHVDHIACFYSESAPASALPYTSGKVGLIPVRPTGGPRFADKLRIISSFPSYARTILRALSKADVVHVRCPANICLLAIVLLGLRRKPKLRWVKYATSWRSNGEESLASTFQRWWLRKGMHRGIVTVNGHWPPQPPHVRSFLNPCLTSAELEAGRVKASKKELCRPLRLLFVGRLEHEKGVGICLEVIAELRNRGVDIHLNIIGEGESRPEFEQKAKSLCLLPHVNFVGGMPRTELAQFYADAHFVLLPTNFKEGWPKVLSEGMAYGAVPLSSEVSCIPEFLQEFETGRSFAFDDVAAFSDAIVEYWRTPALWKQESARALEAAKRFTYDNYLEAVKNILKLA